MIFGITVQFYCRISIKYVTCDLPVSSVEADSIKCESLKDYDLVLAYSVLN